MKYMSSGYVKWKFLLMFHLLSRKATALILKCRISYKSAQSLGRVWSAERAAKARASWTVRAAPRDCHFRDLCREAGLQAQVAWGGLGGRVNGKGVGRSSDNCFEEE